MCAIFGVVGVEEAAKIAYLGLHAQQHRGQEGAGIVTIDSQGEPRVQRKQGLVGEAFDEGALEWLAGRAAVGHVRYSTAGGNTLANLQPLFLKSSLGWIAIAHNGNLVNAGELAKRLEAEGSIFQSTSDTEVIVHLMARSGEKDVVAALVRALREVRGAYSLVVADKSKLVVVRDPFGYRPLVLGELRGAPVFASETCAFELIGAKFVREVEPGEMIVVPLNDPKGAKSSKPFEEVPRRRCVFEQIYFARPDSRLFGEYVQEMRKQFGRRLAQEQPAPNADVVVPVPDSGVPAAIGFAESAKLRFDMGIIRSHYVGRTFIEPKQSIRDFGVKLKLSAVPNVVAGKSVVLVDDSLVRGTTSKKLIAHVRDAGAKEVHFRVSAPPTKWPCFYGIDTPTRKELLAATSDVEQIRRFIGADTLGYLSLEGVLDVAEKASGPGFCHACFSGEYSTPLPQSAVS
jgi:amidophosphoribosyltransferase